MVLALGAAMVAGNVLALVRPPRDGEGDGRLERPPLTRSLVFTGLGLAAALWGLASLLS